MKTADQINPQTQTDLVPIEPRPFVVQSDPEAILRYAIDHNADVSVIERMMVIRKELQQEKSKSAFDAAMAAFQSEVPVIMKTKAVTSGSDKLYSYAPFENIIAQVKGLLQKHGFSYTLDTDVESKDGWVIAKCRVVHSAGHSETSTAKFPLGAGTRAMSTTQIYAAALTFASRRVFCNAFGIVTSGEDTDGMTGKPKPPGPSTLTPERAELKALASELWKVLKDVRGSKQDWGEANKWLFKNNIVGENDEAPNFTPEKFREVITKSEIQLGVA